MPRTALGVGQAVSAACAELFRLAQRLLVGRSSAEDAAASRGRRPSPHDREVVTPLFVAEPADPFDAVLSGWFADRRSADSAPSTERR